MAQRVLVAEDELVVAMDLCNTIAEAGFEIEGPHTGVSSAMLAFQMDKPDLAILDISLVDGNVFQLAKTLVDEKVPIIFHSGRHSPDEVQAQFPSALMLEKPCPPAEVLEMISKVFEPA